MIELVYLGVAVNDLHLQHTAQDLVLVSQPSAMSHAEYLDGYGISQSTRQAYYKTVVLYVRLDLAAQFRDPCR